MSNAGGFWEFTSDLEKKDSAYSQMALEAHTDTTYFTDPAGLQAFHLLSHQNGNGGASLLVDGFRAAEILRTESPKDFDRLCEIKIRSHASGNDGIQIMPDCAFPVITLQEQPDSSGQEPPPLRSVRWNNDDRAALPPMHPQKVVDFYRASKKWVEILRRDELQYWDQLRPGKPISKFVSPSMFFVFCFLFLGRPSEGFATDHEAKSLIIGECSMGDQPLLAIGGCVVVTVRQSVFSFPFVLLFFFFF